MDALKELIEVIESYLANIEYKMEQGYITPEMGEELVGRINDVAGRLKDIDLSIVPKTSASKVQAKYILEYNPAGAMMCPDVTIPSGSEVDIVKEVGDPMGKYVYVSFNGGDKESVPKTWLRKVKASSQDGKSAIGKQIADPLFLKRKSNDRFDTSWGDKTEYGLEATIRRILEDGGVQANVGKLGDTDYDLVRQQPWAYGLGDEASNFSDNEIYEALVAENTIKSNDEEYSLDNFKKDLLEFTKEYFAGDADWNEKDMIAVIERDIKETEDMIGKKIKQVNLSGSADTGVLDGDILFEGDKEWTAFDVWADYYDDKPGISIHLHESDEDGEIEGSVKSKYKKQMADKSEEEIKKALAVLKEGLLNHDLDKELYKEKIKVLEKLLTPKEVKEVEEEVEEKIEDKGEKVEANSKKRIQDWIAMADMSREEQEAQGMEINDYELNQMYEAVEILSELNDSKAQDLLDQYYKGHEAKTESGEEWDVMADSEWLVDVDTYLRSISSTVSASVKSKYKKQMKDKSEDEIKKALADLKEKLMNHDLDKELYKEKIKVLEKLLTPKEVKEIEEKVEEKVDDKKEAVEASAGDMVKKEVMESLDEAFSAVSKSSGMSEPTISKVLSPRAKMQIARVYGLTNEEFEEIFKEWQGGVMANADGISDVELKQIDKAMQDAGRGTGDFDFITSSIPTVKYLMSQGFSLEDIKDAYADWNNNQIKSNKMTKEGQSYISKKIKYLMEKEGMKQDQATAVAYKYAEKEGYKTPKQTKASEDTHVGGFNYKTVKIDSPEAKRLHNKGYKVVITNPNLGTVQFEIPKSKTKAGAHNKFDVWLDGNHIDTVWNTSTDEEEVKRSLIDHDGYDSSIEVKRVDKKAKASDVKADTSKWKEMWSNFGDMETCVNLVTDTDVNNPEKYCEWLKGVATGQMMAEDMSSYWQMFIDAGLLKKEEKAVEASFQDQIVSKYTQSVANFVQAQTDAKVEDFQKSEMFTVFRADVTNMLTEGIKAGKMDIEGLDNILVACNIELSESELNKIISADLPMPTTKPPAGQKWTKEVKADGTMEWVLTMIS